MFNFENFDVYDCTVLIKATKSGHLPNVELVIQKFKDDGKDPRHELRTTDRQGYTAIHYSAEQQSLDILRLLLRYADHDTVNAESFDKTTPLLSALATLRRSFPENPSSDVTEASTSSDADVPVTKKVKRTSNRGAILLALLSAGADPNLPDGDPHVLPLYTALAKGWWEGAKILLEAGASPISTDFAHFSRPAYYYAVNDLSTFKEVAKKGGLIRGFRDFISNSWPTIPNKLGIFKIWAKYDNNEPIIDSVRDFLVRDICYPAEYTGLVADFLLQNYKIETPTLISAYKSIIRGQVRQQSECNRAKIRSTSALIQKKICERFQDRDTVIENALEFLTIEEVSPEDIELFIESIKKHSIPFSKLSVPKLKYQFIILDDIFGAASVGYFEPEDYIKEPDNFDPLFFLLKKCRRNKGLDDLIQKLVVAGMPVTTRSLCFAFWWASIKQTHLKSCLTTVLNNCPPPDPRESLSLVKDDLARAVACMAVLKGAHYNLFILLREGFPACEVEKALIDIWDDHAINHHLYECGAVPDLLGFKILESFLPRVSKALVLKYKDHYTPKESPKSLMDMCRTTIRQNYGFREVQDGLRNLELDLSIPSIIGEFLRYDGDPEHVANQLVAGGCIYQAASQK